MNPSTRRILFPFIMIILLLTACAPAPVATQDPTLIKQLIDQSVTSTVAALNAQATKQQDLIAAQVTLTPTPIIPTTTPFEVTPESTMTAIATSDPNAPTVTSISPNTGFTIGGSIVTITGTNFIVGQGHTHFYFGDDEADPAAVICKSTTRCTVIVPQGTAGNVTVRAVNVTEQTDENGNTDTFAYVAIDPEAPVIEDIGPQEGSIRGGDKVIITGKNFEVGKQGVDLIVTQFFFGKNQATDVVCLSDIQCTVKSPPGEEGYVVVRAENSGRKSQHIPGNDYDGFKYNGTPKYGCDVLTTAPKNLTIFGSGENFVIKWIVANSGENAWPAGMDVKYSSGVNMGDTTRVEIPVVMKPNDTYAIKINAVAPSNPGKYYMTWIVEGMGCDAYVAIIVE